MSTSAPAHRREPATPAEVEHEPSIGELITSAQKDFSQLVKHEVALLKSELRVSVKLGSSWVRRSSTSPTRSRRRHGRTSTTQPRCTCGR